MQHTLAQQWKACPTISHAFNELEFKDFSLDDSIALGPREASFDRLFVSLNPLNKAPQFRDLTGFGLSQPRIKPLSCARAQHLGKRLNQIIRQVHFGMDLAELTNGFLLLSIQLFRASQEQKGRLP